MFSESKEKDPAGQQQPEWEEPKGMAELFLGIRSWNEMQSPGKEQTDPRIGQIDRHPFERKDRCTVMRVDELIEIGRNRKADHRHGRLCLKTPRESLLWC